MVVGLVSDTGPANNWGAMCGFPHSPDFVEFLGNSTNPTESAGTLPEIQRESGQKLPGNRKVSSAPDFEGIGRRAAAVRRPFVEGDAGYCAVTREGLPPGYPPPWVEIGGCRTRPPVNFVEAPLKIRNGNPRIDRGHGLEAGMRMQWHYSRMPTEFNSATQ
jgi:hypothetical protein